jgi:hypothetical protein
VPDFVDFSFHRKAIEGFEPQAGEALDASFERLKGITDGPVLIGFRTLDSSGVRHAPVGGDRFAGPDRAYFAGGLIADGEDEIISGAPGLANSCQLLLRSPCVSRWAFSRRASAKGWTAPLGKLPALCALNRPLPQCSSSASAMMLRAELPVQRNRTL